MSARRLYSVRLLAPIAILISGASLSLAEDPQLDPIASAPGVLTDSLGIATEAPTETYELPGSLPACNLLPEYLLSGELFSVEPEVQNDGETNHYIVRSPLGDAEAAGREALEQAIQDIRALDLLKASRKRTGAAVGFNEGVKSLAGAPYRNVKRVVFNPLYAVKAVPTEIIDYAGKIASVHDLVTDGPVVFVRRSVGIDGARNDLARRLRVDSNTENEALRDEIKRVGWGVWMGGVVPEVSDGYVDLTYDLSTEVGDLGDGNLGRAVDAIRREVLPRSARRLLKKLDVSKMLSKSFRENPNYKGRMRENMAAALLAMPDTEGRTEYIIWANTVKNPGEARRAVQLAQVMAVSNAANEPITRIWRSGDVLEFQMKNGDVVAPVLYDYLIWSESAYRRVAAATGLKEEVAPGRAIAIWTAGDVSPRVREGLAGMGCTIRTDVDRDFPAFERPRKGLQRLEQRYDRRVEDPVKEEVTEQLLPERDRRLELPPLGPVTR